jgi:hypothetical protein
MISGSFAWNFSGKFYTQVLYLGGQTTQGLLMGDGLA